MKNQFFCPDRTEYSFGDIAVVQSAKADCDGFDDPFGCYVAVCTHCIIWTCGTDQSNEFCDS